MPNKRKELSQGSRQAAFILLSQERQDDENAKLRHGALSKVAKIFDCDRTSVAYFWRQMNQKLTTHNLIDRVVYNQPDFFKSKSSDRGRKYLYDISAFKKEVTKAPLDKKGTYRDLSTELAMPLSSLHRMQTRDKAICWHSAALKAILSDENKVARVAYCLEEVNPVAVDGIYYYKDLFNLVNVDEKWFYMTRDNKNYIVVTPDDEYDNLPDENEENTRLPTFRARHKNYIGKVMFLVATARPRFDPQRNQVWDGKIGVWPIGEWVPAQRDSNRRPMGTLVWKDTSIGRNVYRKLLLEKVVPAIVEKWPRAEFASPRVVI